MFLETPDGTAYEVILPEGWQMDRAAAELRGPAGEIVKFGSSLVVRGSIARHRASTCHIGPIFVANEVQLPPG